MGFDFRNLDQQSCSGFLRLAVSLAISILSLRIQLDVTWEVEPLVATRFLQDGTELWSRLRCIPGSLDDGFISNLKARAGVPANTGIVNLQ
jgi:hypothetical protein